MRMAYWGLLLFGVIFLVLTVGWVLTFFGSFSPLIPSAIVGLVLLYVGTRN